MVLAIAIWGYSSGELFLGFFWNFVHRHLTNTVLVACSVREHTSAHTRHRTCVCSNIITYGVMSLLSLTSCDAIGFALPC